MKVLVVDDSVVFRMAIKQALEASPEVSMVRSVNNGKIAVDVLKNEFFDAASIDLEMPVMDGIETIQEIRKFNKTIPLIIFSAQNLAAAEKTLRALDLGADDFVQKTEGTDGVDESVKMIEKELVPRFKSLISNIKAKQALKKTEDYLAPSFNKSGTTTATPALPKVSINQMQSPDILLIGSSTGGPDALKKVVPKLRGDIPIPVLIVQHMPPIFTTQLARSLDNESELTVVEASSGMKLKAGKVYLAPGDFHMTLRKEGGHYTIELNQGPKVCFVRPAVDVTLNSLVECFSGQILTVILTGMGQDGKDGCVALKQKNGNIIIQDQATSIVWGMPKAIFDENLHDTIMPIEKIADSINRIIR